MARVFTDLRITASIALVGALLTVALWPATVVVELTRVSRGPLVVTVDEEGRTRVRDRFVVATPVAGRVLRLELEPGDRLAAGDVVARLQPTAPALLDARTQAEALAGIKSAEASLGHARADEAQAHAMLTQAHRALSRSRRLDVVGGITPDELELRHTEVSRVAAHAQAAEFAVRVASAELERARIRETSLLTRDTGAPILVKAPVDGVVLQRFRESEGVVVTGEPLVEIGDIRRLEVVADVLSTDAVHVAPGSTATVAEWGGDTALAATVRRVEPTGFIKVSALGVEEQRVNVILDFEDAGEDYAPLGDAYRVDARIVLWQASAVLKVPTGALVRDAARWAVYVARDGRARRTIITLGRHTAREAEVTSGLVDGTMVIVHPGDQLRDGARIADRSLPAR
jgi:HlyD family secretion protein